VPDVRGKIAHHTLRIDETRLFGAGCAKSNELHRGLTSCCGRLAALGRRRPYRVASGGASQVPPDGFGGRRGARSAKSARESAQSRRGKPWAAARRHRKLHIEAVDKPAARAFVRGFSAVPTAVCRSG